MTRLKIIREKHGLKLCELAARSGVCYSNLSRYENGWVNPCPETATKIANALSCKISEFYPVEINTGVEEEEGER